jgi:hypothetical protein
MQPFARRRPFQLAPNSRPEGGQGKNDVTVRVGLSTDWLMRSSTPTVESA